MLKKIQITIREHSEYSEPIMSLFGIFGLINYPLFHLYWTYFSQAPARYDDLRLRIIATILCLPLALKSFWPRYLKPFLPYYWYLSVMYCLPFLGTYVFLHDQESKDWAINLMLGLLWLILILDWFSFVFVLIGGIILAYFFYIFNNDDLIYSGYSLSGFFTSIIFIIVTSFIFIRKKDSSHQEKFQTMRMLAGSIAHELRTPLSAMMMGARALGKILPAYQEAYAKAKSANLLEKTVAPDQEAYLAGLPESMETVSKNAHTMITMLLTNLNEGAADQKVEPCSMALCVEEALDTYPFSPDERSLVHWQRDGDSRSGAHTDFTFLGQKELMKHVLFNLFKNALYAIASSDKGEIYITIEPGENTRGKKINQLIFKDTGLGIPLESLPYIFDRFYTKTEHGTGIGLAFCKSVIRGFGGEITCASRQGEHTTFTIAFPIK